MTPKEIATLAGHRIVPPWVMKLALDVAAAEREKAKVVFEELEREVKAEIVNAINGAVELEREACAKVCELLGALNTTTPQNIAAAIRERIQK